jgi:hypothetical protein
MGKNSIIWALFLLCCMVCNAWGQGQETDSGTQDLQILYHQTLHILETS